METIKKYWGYVLAGLGLILAIFKFRDKLATSDAKETLSQTNQKSTELETRRDVNDEEMERIAKELEEKQKTAPGASPSEVEDFYKNRK